MNEHSTVLLYVPVACHLLVQIVTIIESQANLGAVSLDFLKYFKFRKNLDVYITCKLQVFLHYSNNMDSEEKRAK